MEIGYRTVSAVVERMQDHGADYCDEYGEPGYRADAGVILGYYWCHCEHGPEGTDDTGRGKLHALDYHYPRLFAALEDQGWELEWSDEWIVDHNASKCYRTQANSYSWQSSILWTDGEFLTPDDGIDAWVDEVVDNPDRCLSSHVWSVGDLRGAGFVPWPDDDETYESGWHPGQTDDPRDITARIREERGEGVEIVFYLNGVGQFDIRFTAWIREDCDDD